MTTFKYKILEFAPDQKMEKAFNDLGKEGWELVSVCPTSSSEYGLDMVTAFLKKEIS